MLQENYHFKKKMIIDDKFSCIFNIVLKMISEINEKFTSSYKNIVEFHPHPYVRLYTFY